MSNDVKVGSIFLKTDERKKESEWKKKNVYGNVRDGRIELMLLQTMSELRSYATEQRKERDKSLEVIIDVNIDVNDSQKTLPHKSKQNVFIPPVACQHTKSEHVHYECDWYNHRQQEPHLLQKQPCEFKVCNNVISRLRNDVNSKICYYINPRWVTQLIQDRSSW
tara:strand:+ start:239 stop:733 length:495 start_codon:yes stop_codon:yes gene_type:complete